MGKVDSYIDWFLCIKAIHKELQKRKSFWIEGFCRYEEKGGKESKLKEDKYKGHWQEDVVWGVIELSWDGSRVYVS